MKKSQCSSFKSRPIRINRDFLNRNTPAIKRTRSSKLKNKRDVIVTSKSIKEMCNNLSIPTSPVNGSKTDVVTKMLTPASTSTVYTQDQLSPVLSESNLNIRPETKTPNFRRCFIRNEKVNGSLGKRTFTSKEANVALKLGKVIEQCSAPNSLQNSQKANHEAQKLPWVIKKSDKAASVVSAPDHERSSRDGDLSYTEVCDVKILGKVEDAVQKTTTKVSSNAIVKTVQLIQRAVKEKPALPFEAEFPSSKSPEKANVSNDLCTLTIQDKKEQMTPTLLSPHCGVRPSVSCRDISSVKRSSTVSTADLSMSPADPAKSVVAASDKASKVEKSCGDLDLVNIDKREKVYEELKDTILAFDDVHVELSATREKPKKPFEQLKFDVPAFNKRLKLSKEWKVKIPVFDKQKLEERFCDTLEDKIPTPVPVVQLESQKLSEFSTPHGLRCTFTTGKERRVVRADVRRFCRKTAVKRTASSTTLESSASKRPRGDDSASLNTTMECISSEFSTVNSAATNEDMDVDQSQPILSQVEAMDISESTIGNILLCPSTNTEKKSSGGQSLRHISTKKIISSRILRSCKTLSPTGDKDTVPVPQAPSLQLPQSFCNGFHHPDFGASCSPVPMETDDVTALMTIGNTTNIGHDITSMVIEG